MQLTQLGRLRQLSCRRLSISCPSCCLAPTGARLLRVCRRASSSVHMLTSPLRSRACEQRELGAVLCHINKRPQQPLKARTIDPASDAELACKIMRSALKAPRHSCQQQCTHVCRGCAPDTLSGSGRNGKARSFQVTLATSTEASWCCRLRPLSQFRQESVVRQRTKAFCHQQKIDLQ